VVGADTPEELRYVAGVVKAPLVAVIHEKPPTTELTDELLNDVGCAFALHAGVVRYAVIKALQTVLGALKRDGNTGAVRDMMATFEDYNAVLGMDEWLALEGKYAG
jgi:2-methylisocitrate lyase-like PEP mutase family enzyme